MFWTNKLNLYIMFLKHFWKFWCLSNDSTKKNLFFIFDLIFINKSKRWLFIYFRKCNKSQFQLINLHSAGSVKPNLFHPSVYAIGYLQTISHLVFHLYKIIPFEQ